MDRHGMSVTVLAMIMVVGGCLLTGSRTSSEFTVRAGNAQPFFRRFTLVFRFSSAEIKVYTLKSAITKAGLLYAR